MHSGNAHKAGELIQKTVFPAIELRIESASSHRLNIHVILSDKLTDQQLSDFKGQLRLRLIDRPLSDEALIDYARQLDGAKARRHGAPQGYLDNPVALARLGAETAEITKASFEAALKTIPEDRRLVMVPYDCYGGMEKIDWRVQPSEDIYFMQLADIWSGHRSGGTPRNKVNTRCISDAGEARVDSVRSTPLTWPETFLNVCPGEPAALVWDEIK